MELPRVDKKLREARFFLSKMSEQESLAFGDREPFDFFLSGFLGATRTVDYRLRKEQPPLYPQWRARWDTGLTTAQAALMKFLIDDRNEEVHGVGSCRSEKTVKVPVGNRYHDASGTVYAWGPPGATNALLHKPAYGFIIDGVERKVTEACDEYLGLLRDMVFQFKSDHP